MLRFRQRPAAWLAIFAMLLGALAPAINRAVVPGAGAGLLADVCSVAVVGFVEIERTKAPRSGGAAIDLDGEGRQQSHSPDRCPYCCTYAGVAVASPPATGPFVASPGSVRVPLLSFLSPRPHHAWSPSHPRAPPARA